MTQISTKNRLAPFGGRDRDRTDGLIVANDALSQLSYTPTSNGNNFSRAGGSCKTSVGRRFRRGRAYPARSGFIERVTRKSGVQAPRSKSGLIEGAAVALGDDFARVLIKSAGLRHGFDGFLYLR